MEVLSALLGWPGWCPAELLPLGAANASDVRQGGKRLAKSLKLISFGKELGLANPHTKPLTSWLVGSEELTANDVPCPPSPGHNRNVPAVGRPLLQNVSFWVLVLF